MTLVPGDSARIDNRVAALRFRDFHAEWVYVNAPNKEQGQNVPPTEGLQFFGHVAIDGTTEIMTVTLKDLEDRALWSTQLERKHICAACVPLKAARRLAIDQTLYWQIFNDEEEAWYCVGLLNSYAMTEAISPFNPKGDFGERHVHTLPYKLMPAFDSANEDHKCIAALARDIAGQGRKVVEDDSYLNDPSRTLPARRRKMREQLQTMKQFQEMEVLCAAALGTTAFGGDVDE